MHDMRNGSDYGIEIDGLPEGRAVVKLSQSPAVFGRSPASDVFLNDVYIARRHFEIRWNDQMSTHEIVSYDHPNALRVNGAPLSGAKPHLLEIGDTLEVGRLRLKYIKLPEILQ